MHRDRWEPVDTLPDETLGSMGRPTPSLRNERDRLVMCLVGICNGLTVPVQLVTLASSHRLLLAALSDDARGTLEGAVEELVCVGVPIAEVPLRHAECEVGRSAEMTDAVREYARMVAMMAGDAEPGERDDATGSGVYRSGSWPPFVGSVERELALTAVLLDNLLPDYRGDDEPWLRRERRALLRWLVEHEHRREQR